MRPPEELVPQIHAMSPMPGEMGQVGGPGYSSGNDHRAASTTSMVVSNSDLNTRIELTPLEKKVKEFRSLLKNMEARIANPSDLNAVGNMYSKLLKWSEEHDLQGLDWTARHVANHEVQEILEMLEYEPMYPAWRRQALDEAYALLFDDIAKQGDRSAVEALPEPYIPQEVGYRILNEHLLQTFNSKGGVLQGEHDQSGRCYCASKKNEYQIRCGPPVYYDSNREKSVCGREIVATGMSERQCCLDPISAAVNAIMPAGCVGRAGGNLWSILGLDQDSTSAIRDKPVWPQPPSDAYTDSNQPQEYGQQYGQQVNQGDPNLSAPQDMSSRSKRNKSSSRRHRDELLQPSMGETWWQ